MRNSLLGLFIVLCVGCGVVEGGELARHGSKIVLVTGATGTQGGAVARELLQRGYNVRGLTRNPESDRAAMMSKSGVVMFRGDFDDAASLAAAMDGADGVFAVTNFWEHGYAKEVRHGRQLVDAAIAAGVKHFVFTSVGGANEGTGIPHFDSKGEIEQYLRGSGIRFSIVQPVEFMDNVLYDRENILSGTYSDPRDPDRSHQWIAASDIGFFVGEAFDNPQEWVGRTVEIAGDQLTIGEFVGLLAQVAGVDVQYKQLTWGEYKEQAGAEMTAMLRWFDESGYDADVAALRERYPNLLTYEEYLRALDWD